MPDNESQITINGKSLSIGEAMTLRVAVETFYMDMHQNGCGDDDIGRSICKGYIKNCKTIVRKIHNVKDCNE